MTLWKEVIRIPEQQEDNRYVVELSSVRDPSRAHDIVDTYVVTESVRASFEEALGGISEAIETGSRRGYFLHGTFGSGKSHFMAVLYLILNGFEEALSINRLAEPVKKFQDKHDGKSFLLVPFHFIGATSIEQMVFRTYIEHVRKSDPDAPRPALLATEKVFKTAASLRRDLGDATFLAKLNDVDAESDADDEDLWGETVSSARWTTESYERAVSAEPGSAERASLLRSLANIDIFENSFDFAAGSSGGSWDQEQFVDLDSGLHEMAVHAKGLGYDGLVLFLDELILWLMSRSEATDFVQREVSKLVKFVESRANRSDEVPIISFIARQKQFSAFLDTAEVGTQRATIGSEVSHFEKRFHEIRLPSQDIAEIASERLLKPVDSKAKKQICESFNATIGQLERTSADKVDTLTTRDYSREYFQQVYPFTPALATVLLPLSDTLQRNRSALLMMTDLLVRRRDELKLGDLISVGRLWDVLENEEPMEHHIKERFKQARELWSQTFDPYLRKRDNLPLSGPIENAGGNKVRYEQDAIVLKTLLIQSLVPHAEPLLSLTVRKLVTLNSSDIRSQFAGAAESGVLSRLTAIASEIPAIDVGEGSNPHVRIVLSKVDVNRLINENIEQDNPSRRSQEFRRLFLGEAGYDDLKTAKKEFNFAWNGARRKAELHFTNVRRASETDFLSRDAIRLVIDYPFDDEPLKKPTDDYVNLESILERDTFRQRRDDAFSIVWLPHHFSEGLRESLGRLAIVRSMLQNPRHSLRSVPEDLRGEAEQRLHAMKETLEKNIRSAILDAYHLSGGEGLDTIGEKLEDPAQFFSNTFLDEKTFEKPSATTVEKAVEELLRQGFRKRFPDAPQAPSLPEEPLGKTTLGKFADAMVDAFESQSSSYSLSSLDKATREAVLRYGESLKLIETGAADSNNVKVSEYWKRLFNRRQNENPTSRLDVGWMRDVIDPNERTTGIPQDLQDVIILAWAAGNGFGFRDLADEVDARVGALANHYELFEAALPSEGGWKQFAEAQDALLGSVQRFRRSPRGVTAAATAFRQKFESFAQVLENLEGILGRFAEKVGLSEDKWRQAPRQRNIVAARKLATAAVARYPSDADLVEAVADILKRFEDLAFVRVAQQAEIAKHQQLMLVNATFSDLFELAEKEPDSVIIRETHDTLYYQEGVTSLDNLRSLDGQAREYLGELRRDEMARLKRESTRVEKGVAEEIVTHEAQGAAHVAEEPASGERQNVSNEAFTNSYSLRAETLDEVVSRLKELAEAGGEYIVEIRKK